jgi:TetR/AcrR family fatty acid metabolism transcriptional regulator
MTVSERGVSLRERQRQEREQLILRAASDLFVERGYHDTSMDDIAARVGIAKGTVYLHFASKEDLAVALIEQGARRFAQALDTILASDGTPRVKLETIFERTYCSMDESISQTFAAIFRSPEIIARMRDRHDNMSAIWREPMRRLSETLDEGKAMGEFDPEIPTPIMLNLFMGLVAPHRWERPIEGKMPFTEIARHISRFFFKGIASGEPSEHAPPPAPSSAS